MHCRPQKLLPSCTFFPHHCPQFKSLFNPVRSWWIFFSLLCSVHNSKSYSCAWKFFLAPCIHQCKWVHPCLDYTLMDYSQLDYSWLDYCHLDYLWCLDYCRLDYFRLQGHSDYRDIWNIAIWTIAVWTILDYRDVWTTRIFGLSLFGLLRQTG